MDLARSKVFFDIAPGDMYKFLICKNDSLCAIVCKYYDRQRLLSLGSNLNLEPGDHSYKSMPYFVVYEDLFPNVYHGFIKINSLQLVPV